MKRKICDFVFNNRKNFVLIMYLYSFLCAFFPYSKIAKLIYDSATSTDIAFIVSRLILSAFPFLVFCFATDNLIVINKRNYLILLSILLICINNFPFISIFLGKLQVNSGAILWIIHILKCLSTSVLEELIFRGVIFSLIYDILSKRKNKLLLSIVFSSATFAFLHIVNLLSGEHIFYVAVQISYSLLTGILFATAYFLSKNILAPIVFHFIYNFGGLLQESNLISGQIWCVYQVVETIIISVIIGIFILIYILKINGETNDEGSSSKG